MPEEKAEVQAEAPGRLRIMVWAQPASLQGTPANKERLRTLLQDAIQGASWVFIHDVRVTIEWLVHEHARYRGNQSPDIDNIVKPILDALSGPTGVIVNDCQVQSIHCLWVDAPPHAYDMSRLQIDLEGFSWDTLSRDELQFVEWPDHMCTIVPRSLPAGLQLELLRSQERGRQTF